MQRRRANLSGFLLLPVLLLLLALACGPATPPEQSAPPAATTTAEPTPTPTKAPPEGLVPTPSAEEVVEETDAGETPLPPELFTPEPRPTRRAIDIEYCRNLRMLFDDREYWDYSQKCRGLIHTTALADCDLPATTGADYHELNLEQQTCLKAQYELVRDYAHRSSLGYPCLAVGLETEEEYISCHLTAGFKPVNQAGQWKDILTMIYASVDQKDAVVKAKGPLFECLTQHQKGLAADDVGTLQPLFWIDLLRDPSLKSDFDSWESDRQGKIRQRAVAIDVCAEKTGYYEVFYREVIAEIKRLQQIDPAAMEPITLFGWLEYIKETGYIGFKPRPDKF